MNSTAKFPVYFDPVSDTYLYKDEEIEIILQANPAGGIKIESNKINIYVRAYVVNPPDKISRLSFEIASHKMELKRFSSSGLIASKNYDFYPKEEVTLSVNEDLELKLKDRSINFNISVNLEEKEKYSLMIIVKNINSVEFSYNPRDEIKVLPIKRYEIIFDGIIVITPLIMFSAIIYLTKAPFRDTDLNNLFSLVFNNSAIQTTMQSLLILYLLLFLIIGIPYPKDFKKPFLGNYTKSAGVLFIIELPAAAMISFVTNLRIWGIYSFLIVLINTIIGSLIFIIWLNNLKVLDKKTKEFSDL